MVKDASRCLLALALLVPTSAGADLWAEGRVCKAPETRAPIFLGSSASTAENGGDPPFFFDGFDSGDFTNWFLSEINMDVALSKTSISLPGDAQNAVERALLVNYLGTGKSIDGAAREQLPFRAHFASCGQDTEQPKMYVSLTLKDTGPTADPDHPRVGAILETEFNPETGALEPTGNQAVLPLCNEAHGIVASADCSRVALTCATALEEPVSETYPGVFRDLVVESGADSFYTEQVNNEHIIDANFPDLPQDERDLLYKYNGEVWLLEWTDPSNLGAEPDKYVIHKGYGGGHPYTGPSLVYSETDDSYASAFATNLFDENSGGRHYSAALMIVERDGWQLNPNDRGWGWLCADGHVFTVRAFWNPFITDEREGEFGALCTSDGNRYTAAQAGSIGIKYESSDLFEGYINYLAASNNSGVSNGGGHTLIPIDETRSIGVITAAEMEPYDDAGYAAFIAQAEQAAIDFFGLEQAQALGMVGLVACNWWSDNNCLFEYARWEFSGTFPLFEWGFWWKDHQNFVPKDLSKIGIFHAENSSAGGRNMPQDDGAMVKWIAEDDDCMLGAPHLVDLGNGRFLLGYGKYQCIGDGYHLRRFATGANGTCSVSTLIPRQYYIMEIDADGNALTLPTLVPGSGWGAMDTMVGLGDGRAAWAYVPSPEMNVDDCTFPDPERSTWELMVYQSPLH